MSWKNSLTIPWCDITKFPDMGQMAKIPWHLSKFPDFSLIWRKFCFSLTRGNPEEITSRANIYKLPLQSLANNNQFGYSEQHLKINIDFSPQDISVIDVVTAISTPSIYLVLSHVISPSAVCDNINVRKVRLQPVPFTVTTLKRRAESKYLNVSLSRIELPINEEYSFGHFPVCLLSFLQSYIVLRFCSRSPHL